MRCTNLEVIRNVVLAAPRRTKQSLRLIVVRRRALAVRGGRMRVVVGVALGGGLVLCSRSHSRGRWCANSLERCEVRYAGSGRKGVDKEKKIADG